MICYKGHSIISPLGFSSEETFDAVRALSEGVVKESAAKLYDDLFDIPEPFFASLIDSYELSTAFERISTGVRYTKVEQAAILAAYGAINKAGIDPAADNVIFILSSTKGNVELLDNCAGFYRERVYLWKSAVLIASFFGNNNVPSVVSNACISGCAAQILAARLLKAGKYKYAVVIGADMLSKFVISGFQSFKSLSPELCRPFDADRIGLNLGEAAAAVVLENRDWAPVGTIAITGGSIHNDANHISGPSRTAEGLYRGLRDLTPDAQQLAFINAHGTSTPYNDDMESVGIDRAGLNQVPVNSLKGYFGHTLGAAGVLETIISSMALHEGIVLRSRGTINPGTVRKVNPAMEQLRTDKRMFLKMMSGFGGCNAAMMFEEVTR